MSNDDTATKHAKARADVAAKRAQALAARPANTPTRPPRRGPPPASRRDARPQALATAPPKNDTATKFAKARERVAAKRAQALAARQPVACKFTCYDELLPLYGETRSRTQLRRAIEAGEYPAPKQLSPQRIGWSTQLLDDYYDALPVVDYAPAAKGRVA